MLVFWLADTYAFMIFKTEALHNLVMKSHPDTSDWSQLNWLPEIPEVYVMDD
jgi:hypothetical protein